MSCSFNRSITHDHVTSGRDNSQSVVIVNTDINAVSAY
jgi:hypothetical protein